MYSIKAGTVALLILLTTACGGITDDLRPSGADQRGGNGNVEPTTIANLSLPSIDGGVIDVASLLEDHDGVVLYFTMWCPVCDSHMSHLRSAQTSRFPRVAFVLVDYVSGSVNEARMAATAAGFAGPPFMVAADTAGEAEDRLQATMGTTVVIGPGMRLLLNEDYKDGAKLAETLAGL
ncbi:MAG: hypothetical protein HQK87_02200 [Nitrospinae bacterium]|nr:hypothetical protein [Nitrospinota bacterium]